MKNIFLLFFITALLVLGCKGGRSVANRYYLLEYPSDVIIHLHDTSTLLEKTCFLNPVNIYPVFSTNQIVYRENSHEIKYYSFNQWAVRPESSFTRMLMDFLEIYSVFGKVYSNSQINDSDYSIETSVQRLEVIRERKTYYANLNVRFRLADNKSGEILTEYVASRKTRMEERNLNLFAAAISEMFVMEFSVFINEILKDDKND